MSLKQEMPEQKPEERIGNFDEVALGYTEQQAVIEAGRCLECKNPQCVAGCPVNIDIPGFVSRIKNKDFDRAIGILKESNALPAICGRVCPQEEQCEKFCILGKKGQPLAIGRLERFCADYERDAGVKSPEKPKSSGKNVAVIGAGPAGLTAAAELAKAGHGVTIYEALHEPGGVLTYGIPEFRLPKDIVRQEVDYIRNLGVDIKVDYVIGRIKTLDELRDEFDAVFVGTGAGLPRFMRIEGENLNGVYSANEFLTRVNLMKAYRFPDYDTPIKCGNKVVVVGAGNVAMDAARSALRLGAEEVTVVYRRSEAEMSARIEEVEHAKEEGVVFNLLTNPVRILEGENKTVTGVECVNMELGEPDESGRRRPIPIEGSEHVIDADIIIVAIGTSPNPVIFAGSEELETTSKGTIVVDEDAMSSLAGLCAGGDVVTGAATVISAMGAGKQAVATINRYIENRS
ncbi:sulfide dehydrogenase (flavoprotein) subunit SudA [Methanohalophilus euhalobius]|uniref:Sulfide dehydrogenase (Flavoprotein) subunit SudA n=2 Tax=Methanohalophilus TaxID=2175 RepID=A0A285G759_9EURY|nr:MULTISPECIES: NADPH-dependent glutamate synthase [Methanohalophilus]ODV49289.1 MAG: glutamate synthase (NADPH/NADH) small chain [Methanohalophilus sp. 2-GBenrich]RSD33998.1 MAG: glutamate synthase (NADPH/NADH) small chain [Methanohalophilus sp.]TCL12440.1 sulfide dehydrogenase (flavoprotein) subunit SudA [Methanohalophilus euhalobius]SNY19193.1 sulfide dehydrogenase (flavoprotein) subunit SudA [Methanohalophilus euhalobius]